MAETSTGLDENLAGALAYLFGFITGVIFLVLESDNRFVRFHAAQSIVVSIVAIAISFVFTIISVILAFIPRIGGILSGLFGLLGFVIWAVFGLIWLFLMYKAFTHDRYALPVIGGLASRIV